MTRPAAPTAGSSLAAFARDIKLAHTIFALPFALAAAWLVTQQQTVSWTQWALIVLAMFMARSSAMGFNRVVDRRIDAANPRTQGREIPAGNLSPAWAWGLTLASAGGLVAVSWALHPLALALSPIAIIVLWGYSLAKRFTSLCHIWLGVALGLAPIAVWVALTGTVEPPALLLSATVGTWVAGFDIMYALQDRVFDANAGLHSVPVLLGERGALWASGLLHILTVAAMAALPFVTPLGWPYWLGWALMTGVLAWEHSLVRPGDLSKMNQAFFAANGYIALIFLAAIVAATWVV